MRTPSLFRFLALTGCSRLVWALPILLWAASSQAARCPNVHIILDRSGSMSSTMPGTTGTRWTVAKDAVKNVLSQYNAKLPLGMSIFPAAGCDSQLVTEPVYGSQTTIETAMAASGPSGSTPSATAVRDAQALGSLNDPKRAQYIILITDGGPGCGTLDTCPGTVNEITKARMKSPSINTFVVGFGGGLSSSESNCLTQMAIAGGKATTSPEKYYKADTAAELSRALADILKVVTGGGEAGTGDGICYR